MYESFFGFRERPFSKTPDPRFFFMSRSHREALARMLHAVEERDLALLTGPIGSGKTTISRALADQLGCSYKIILLINPRVTPLELLRTLARHLGVTDPSLIKTDLLAQIGERLYWFFEQNICPVLVIDEAQLVPHKETFDEVRLLTNFQLDDRNLLSVILMGQPELRQRLAHRVYEPLRQRIGMHFELRSLSREETAEYLNFRIQAAGGRPGLFLADAIERVHEFSQGVPRRINQVAALALIEAFGRDMRHLDGDVLDAVMDELRFSTP
jgi:general secretion pathway protein A